MCVYIYTHIFDFACLKSALKETHHILFSLSNLERGMESVLGHITSCRNSEAIRTLLLFSPSFKVGFNIASGLKRSCTEVSENDPMRK